MKKLSNLFYATVLFLPLIAVSQAQTKGNLVIAGGGLEDNNASV